MAVLGLSTNGAHRFSWLTLSHGLWPMLLEPTLLFFLLKTWQRLNLPLHRVHINAWFNILKNGLCSLWPCALFKTTLHTLHFSSFRGICMLHRAASPQKQLSPSVNTQPWKRYHFPKSGWLFHTTTPARKSHQADKMLQDWPGLCHTRAESLQLQFWDY